MRTYAASLNNITCWLAVVQLLFLVLLVFCFNTRFRLGDFFPAIIIFRFKYRKNLLEVTYGEYREHASNLIFKTIQVQAISPTFSLICELVDWSVVSSRGIHFAQSFRTPQFLGVMRPSAIFRMSVI